jgi:hypothetical protein
VSQDENVWYLNNRDVSKNEDGIFGIPIVNREPITKNESRVNHGGKNDDVVKIEQPSTNGLTHHKKLESCLSSSRDGN